jgi:hypothetical protein
MPEESHEGEEEDGAGAVHQGQEEHADKQTHGPVKTNLGKQVDNI